MYKTLAIYNENVAIASHIDYQFRTLLKGLDKNEYDVILAQSTIAYLKVWKSIQISLILNTAPPNQIPQRILLLNIFNHVATPYLSLIRNLYLATDIKFLEQNLKEERKPKSINISNLERNTHRLIRSNIDFFATLTPQFQQLARIHALQESIATTEVH